MNYLIYPLKIMNLTQGYEAHGSHSKGNIKDYPIDDNGGSAKKDAYFYCPCDEMVIKKIYGVGQKAGNTLWLESTSPVITPTFEDYVTIMVVHPNDSEFKNKKVGQKFKRYEKIVLEGDDGNATGYHLHISVGRGRLKGSGWEENNHGAWVIKTTEGAVKPEEAFFVDSNFTIIKGTKNIPFIKLDKEQIGAKSYYVTESLNVRLGPGTSYQAINSLPAGTMVNVAEEKGTWSRISATEWVSHNFLTTKIPNKVYYTKKTTTSLNVRNKPNGQKLSEKAPLPKNTTVAVMATSGKWTKINENRWAFSAYLT